MSVDIATYVHDLAVEAKAASGALATASDEQRQDAVRAMAAALRDGVDSIVAANELDMSAARDAGTSAGLLDRLLLTPERIEGMAAGLEKLAELPDPVGRVLDHRVLASGVDLTRVSVPLGLVAMVYEARPNVTADAAGICIRTGNACILRGGSLAYHTCAMISELLADALEAKGFPREAVSMIESTDREATGELMKLRGIVDVLIPRGGAGLIQRCVRESLVPVIETGTGNCHIYVHESADFDKALNIIVNAKTQRVGVCNAAESLLVDRAVADSFLPAVVAVLHDHGVLMHGDEATCAACADAGLVEGDDYVAATEEDWGREYLALEMSVKVVADEDEAIAHINRCGTMHSEAIVADPKLVLADEPTGALDSKSARLLLESLEALNRRLRATVLMVTHDSFAASYTSRVLFIRDGKIFTELRRGDTDRREFFDRIMEVVAMMGGEGSDAL